jgi:peptidoglycan/LPS O-acetylase OafA/YrhL
MYVLSDTLRRGNNNFDLIRLLASLMVMLGHSYGMQAGGFESMLLLTHLESFASLAVYGFFLISGMLVTASFGARSTVIRFVTARAARIWPGVIVCSAFIAFVIGPIFTTLPLLQYLSAPEVLHWFACNASLLGSVGGPLPGLFADHHAKFLVNSPAWTLPVELKCYVLVLLAGSAGLIASGRRVLGFCTVAGLLFAYFVMHSPHIHFLQDFFVLQMGYSFYPVPFFLLGMLLYGFRERVFLSGRLALVLLVGAVFLRYSWPGTIFFYLCFAYGLLWLASARIFLRLRPRHDYSYGIYLYGFVIQQVFSGFEPAMNSYLSLLFTVPITVVMAAISWHLVEHPVLALVRRRSGSDVLHIPLQAANIDS